MRPRRPLRASDPALLAALLAAAAAPSCLVDVPPIEGPDGTGGSGGGSGSSGSGSGVGGGDPGGNGGAGGTGAGPSNAGSGGEGGGPVACVPGCPEGTACDNGICALLAPTPDCADAIDASQGGVFSADRGVLCEGASLEGCTSEPSLAALFRLGVAENGTYRVHLHNMSAHLGGVQDPSICTGYLTCISSGTPNGVTHDFPGGSVIGALRTSATCQQKLVLTITPL
jgi:hypothetical protein